MSKEESSQIALANTVVHAPLCNREQALESALEKFVAWHDMDHEAMEGWEVQAAYDKAIDAAKSALRNFKRS